MLLPNAEQAINDDQKLTGYALNAQHEEGKHKAFVFKAVLGITAADVDEVKARIHLEIFRNSAQIGREDKFGKPVRRCGYSIKVDWTHSGRTATVLTS